MIDPTQETLIPLLRVPRIAWLPRRRREKRLAPSTVFRWCQRGVRGVRLETLRVGGTRCTSEAALRRFFERLSGGGPGLMQSTPGDQNRHAAERLLDKEGLR
jgi:hypothetical protein